MPLSEHEQRILDEIERRLAAEDPKFARATGVATPRATAMRRIRRATLGFGMGLAILVAGLFVPDLLLAFGLGGFVVMLASVVVVTRAMKDIGRNGPAPPSWLGRFEDRWRKRFDRGDGAS